MARARNIKPGLYKNEDLAECSIWARYLFPGLSTIADREGRLEDRPKRIKAELLPFDSQDVEPLLKELCARGFIERYEVGGHRYIEIRTFTRHQSPHYSEKPSVIPPPDSRSHDAIMRGQQPPDSLIPDSLIPDSKTFAPSAAHSTPKKNGRHRIEFNRDKGLFIGITEEQELLWQEAYPAVPIPPAIARAAAWAKENPANAKSNWGRFLVNWFQRDQDKAARVRR